MDFDQLATLIFEEMVPKLEGNRGLAIFAAERAKFEGWLKLELCESLSGHFKDVVPERDRIDITFDQWAIQLKTVNTNIRFREVKNKRRPITKNTQGVIEDVEKLMSKNFENKAVLFVVFPITHENDYWQIQLKRILSKVKQIHHTNFFFGDSRIPGVMYFALI